MSGDIHISVASSEDERREALNTAMRLIAARSADDLNIYVAEINDVYRELLAEIPSIRLLDEGERDKFVTRIATLIDALVATGWAVGLAAEKTDEMRVKEGFTIEDAPIRKEQLLDAVEKVLEGTSWTPGQSDD